MKLAWILAWLAIATTLRAQSAGFLDPATHGGQWLTRIPGSSLGEPINVVISNASSPDVLTRTGFLQYAQSLGFSTECLGQTDPTHQAANLGDGNGYLNETAVYRQDYGDLSVGTCQESVVGGNHFRFWIQASTGAYFLAVSQEASLQDGHTIVTTPRNGYDLGRDLLIANATTGLRSQNGTSYQATYTAEQGFLQQGSTGINHGLSIDGLVDVLTVTIVATATTTSSIASTTSVPVVGTTLVSTSASPSPAVSTPLRTSDARTKIPLCTAVLAVVTVLIRLVV